MNPPTFGPLFAMPSPVMALRLHLSFPSLGASEQARPARPSRQPPRCSSNGVFEAGRAGAGRVPWQAGGVALPAGGLQAQRGPHQARRAAWAPSMNQNHVKARVLPGAAQHWRRPPGTSAAGRATPQKTLCCSGPSLRGVAHLPARGHHHPKPAGVGPPPRQPGRAGAPRDARGHRGPRGGGQRGRAGAAQIPRSCARPGRAGGGRGAGSSARSLRAAPRPRG